MNQSAKKFTDARELAAELLYRARVGGPFVSDLLDEWADDSGLAARDRRLAHELAAGVIRHRRTLDCVLNAFTRRMLVKSPPPLRMLVRLGAYQLLFLDRIPDHAAVDQTVELAKRWARPRIRKHPASIAGFVNGLLRAIAPAIHPVDSARGQDPRRLVERSGADRFVLLDRDAFASPDESPAGFLADAYSFDDWLAGRWVEQFGLLRARDLARAQNRRPSLTLRVNSLRIDAENVRGMLAGDGVQTKLVRPPQTPPLLRVVDGDALGSKAMMMGLIQPQDAWVASIVARLDVRPGQTVLDRCAAPGTKTIQMAELMDNRGSILAVDVSAEGLDRVRTNAKRMGVHIIRTMPADDMPDRLLGVGGIDRVLVDVPCSNSGVLARRPEARWRIGPESIRQLARTQRELLMDGLNWVTPGGRVVYATCSLEPGENEQVVEYVVKRRQGQARLLADKLTLPSLLDDHDGGYWALIERVR